MSGLVVQGGDASRLAVHLVQAQRWAEREAVRAQVLRDPGLELEVRLTDVAVEPDRRQLGDGSAQAAGLGGELQADLEAAAAVDAHLADEVGGVGLEAVR